MTRLQLGPFTVDVDVDATRRLYQALENPDPQCCNACATFLLLVERRMLPDALVQFMSGAGITPSKPVEAWGAPDGGFLQVWWEFIGRSTTPGAVFDNTPIVELEPGVRYAVTDHHPPSSWALERKQTLPALEVTWEHDAVRYLEGDAWPEWLHGERDPEVGA
jgi:hypothetical protein